MEDGKKAWEGLLRRMLPAGAPLPDEEELDYSISVDYVGPTQPPRVSTSANRDVSSTMPPMLSSKFGRVRGADFLPPPHSGNRTILGFEDSVAGEDSDSDSDSNSMFSLSLSGDQFDSPLENPQKDMARSRACEISNLEPSNYYYSRVSLRSLFAQSGNPNGEEEFGVPREEATGKREDTETESVNFSTPRGEGKKKGVCSRCRKGSRLSVRETCIVCGAKYCKGCVLKAMGSMPEGRKCVTCIEHPINECNRPKLGTNPRLLSMMLCSSEVKQILKAERECVVNQLRPEQVVVNGTRLTQEELAELFACRTPPQSLKPGRYWYDKDSGLWGKEGRKPDRVITSKLNVGGKLQKNASNGKTKVFINGREVTKVELRVLKLAKVQCSPDTHFWVYDDGSYEEEGQNNIKGNIWQKASTRMMSSLLSLPVPPGSCDGPRLEASPCQSKDLTEYWELSKLQKLLLLGLGGSGTSTIFKQTKFLYGNHLSKEEIQNMKSVIQSSLYKYLGVLLEGRERFEEEAFKNMRDETSSVSITGSGQLVVNERMDCLFSLHPRLKKQADWFLEIMASGDLDVFFPAATREYAPLVEEIWKDAAIQETYKRKDELPFLPDVAESFLNRAIEISSNDYEPSEEDIIYAEGVPRSNGLASFDFSFDDWNPMLGLYDKSECPAPLNKYQLIHMYTKGLQDGCKWLEMFEDVRAVIFCVALTDYDEVWSDGIDHRNKLMVCKELFESLATHPSFMDTTFVLFLNKYDVLEEKIRQVPLTVCEWFEDFYPVRPHNNGRAQASQAYYYVAVKFKELYASITGRKLFVWPTKALDRTSVDEAFRYVREAIKWEDVKKDRTLFPVTGDSLCSPEMYSNFIRQE